MVDCSKICPDGLNLLITTTFSKMKAPKKVDDLFENETLCEVAKGLQKFMAK